MDQRVVSFNELSPELWPMAGGKGGMLARMVQAGFPVPDGFIILPPAFQGGKLNPEDWQVIQRKLQAMRKKDQEVLFAVRSSALSEDSARASFAGAFESVLNVNTDEEVQEAIAAVYRSAGSERVKAYSAVQGIEPSHPIAVVVQRMVPAEFSGVLFTADPITDSRAKMTGNFVYGLGERLVSGEANAYSCAWTRPKGRYEGPRDLKKICS